MCPPLQLPKAEASSPIGATEDVVQSLQGATTLMLCDIHLSLGGARGVIELLTVHGLTPSVNYLYLPRGYARKSKRRCNGSLSAFVNFTSPDMAAHAARAFHGMTIQDRRVYVCRARAQGVAANLLHFRTVRSGQDLPETSWPFVRRDGQLVETHPAEVAAALHIESEVACLRAKLDAATDASSEPTEATPTSTAPAAPVPAALLGQAIPMPAFTPDMFQVSPDLIAAYAQLLATMSTVPPAGQAAPDDWFTGKLDWSLPPQYSTPTC